MSNLGEKSDPDLTWARGPAMPEPQAPSPSKLSPWRFPAIVGRVVATALILSLPAQSPVFADETADPHAMHHHMVTPQTTRSVADYKVPELKLVRDDEMTVSLRDELADGRRVVLSFIYTTCTTICPITSQTLSDLQSKLGAARDSVHFVSISIDPEQDTPARLREYAKKFGAGPQWNHYTGTLASSVAVQKAFGAYFGDKMSHRPVTLLRAAGDSRWIRIDGLASAEQMLAELQHLDSAP